MRYLLIVLMLLPSLVLAQDDWGPAERADNESWWWSCDSSGVLYGYYSPSVSANDSLLFFIPWCFGPNNIAYSTYLDGIWQQPSTIPDSIIGGNASSIFYHDPDSTLYFHAHERYGLWRTRLRDGVWQNAESLGILINTTGTETYPSLPSDGSKLYFFRDDIIMSADIIDGNFEEPVALPAIINSPDSLEDNPRISPDGTKLYFNRWQNYLGPYNMFVSTLSGGAWQAAVQLDSDINFGDPNPECMNVYGASILPSFSLNGTKMYFEFANVVGQICEPGMTVFVSELLSGVSEQQDVIPNQFSISAYPNPFNAEVSINISGDISLITEITIYNIAGQRVRTLPSAPSVIWDGKDAAQNDVSSGIYFVRAVSGDQARAIKVALVR